MAQRKRNSKKSTGPDFKKFLAGLAAFLKSRQTHRMLGVFCWIFALLLLISFISFAFNWQVDQSKVHDGGFSFLWNTGVRTHNALGRLGTFLSHIFFYKGFGLASFLLVAVVFLTGTKLVRQSVGYSLSRVYQYAFWSIVLLSTLFGFLSGGFSTDFPFAGNFGKYASTQLVGFAGFIGAGLILLFGIAALLIMLFNMSPDPDDWTAPAKAKSLWQRVFGLLSRKGKAVAKSGGDTALAETAAAATEMPPGRQAELDFEQKNGKNAKDLLLDIVKPKKAVAVEEETEEAESVPDDGDYNPRLDLRDYKFPSIDFLEKYGRDLHQNDVIEISKEELEANKQQIQQTLNNYGIDISSITATPGPTVTLFEIVPAKGVRISRIRSLEDDIALSLSALGIRIIAPMPGKGTVGIEVPNTKKEVVSLRGILESDEFTKSKMTLPVALGRTISDECYVADLSRMPHLLMAGATGQGKSVCLNSLLISLLYRKHPAELKFVMIDPKKVELSLFNMIERHYLAKLPDEEEPIVTDTKKVIATLNALCIEMDIRYDLLKKAHVRNIKEYNQKFVKRKLNPNNGHRFLPYIVLVIDEFADLIMTAGKEIEMPIARLAQLARAVGLHLIIATQRPTVNIITGTIKANFPVRVAFRVTSKVDSRTILDAAGANRLIGRGDMLLSIGAETLRLQGAFVDTHEVERVAEHIGSQRGYENAYLLPEYSDEDNAYGSAGGVEFDDLFDEAARVIVQHQSGSTSLLQRRLKLGYNRAGRLMDQLETAGVVGPNVGSKAREVYIPDLYELDMYLESLKQQ